MAHVNSPHAKFTSTLIGLFIVVTNVSVKFEKYSVEIQDFVTITHHFRIIFELSLQSNKENQKMSTFNQLGLDTLGS
jgi:hypothetical protein